MATFMELDLTGRIATLMGAMVYPVLAISARPFYGKVIIVKLQNVVARTLEKVRRACSDKFSSQPSGRMYPAWQFGSNCESHTVDDVMLSACYE